jgi:hypothetical protein
VVQNLIATLARSDQTDIPQIERQQFLQGRGNSPQRSLFPCSSPPRGVQ